jgi:hypothetical protein
MSQEKLQAFAEAVSKSEELQKQYISIQVEIARSTAEKLAKLSESAGTPFTAEEYLKSVVASSEEMSTEQLRSVAGGANEFWWTYFESIIPGPNIGVDCAVQKVSAMFDRSLSLGPCPLKKS